MNRHVIRLAAALAVSLPSLHTLPASADDPMSRIKAICEQAVWPQFDCVCITSEFVASGQEETEANLNAFFEQHTRSGKTRCVNHERILAGEKRFCESNFKMAFKNLDCGCFAEYVLDKFESYPYQRTAYLSDLRTKAISACK
mgnify:CR=1 FL=1